MCFSCWYPRGKIYGYGNLESGNQLMRYKNIVWHIQTIKPAWNEKIYTLKQSFPFFLSNKMIFVDIYKKS